MPSALGAFTQTQPLCAPVTFTSADTTTQKTVSGPVGGPWRVTGILVTSDDTAAQVLDVFIRITTTSYLIGSISIPAGTGKAGAATKDFISEQIPAAITGIDITSSEQIWAAMEATITAAKTVTVTLLGGQY